MEKFKEIERSIITTYRARIWSKFTKAINEFNLVEPNDKICVCISGGKDSMLLAKLFQELHKHTRIPFDLVYLVMNPGYNDKNMHLIENNLKLLNIPAEIVKTDIFEISNEMEKNPCYICARMRRGALYRIAKEFNCNKIALGHHFDDVIETTLMNMLNTGSFQTMLPKIKSDNYLDMELIRPMYFIHEKDIITWKNSCQLNFIECACKLTENIHKFNDKHSSYRLKTKELIKDLKSYNPNVEMNIFKSAYNVNLDKIIGYKTNGKYHFYLDNYNTKNKS